MNTRSPEDDGCHLLPPATSGLYSECLTLLELFIRITDPQRRQRVIEFARRLLKH